MQWRIVWVGLALVMAGTTVGQAGSELPVGSSPAALDSVVWAGQGTNYQALAGKTTVVLTYPTWCPKCNAWSGNMVSDLKKAIQGKPVVVLAISTDTLPPKAVQYMAQRQFIGPNILHGYDPTIARRFGFEGEFFNYAIIGPDGKITNSGSAGSYYTPPEGRTFSTAYELGRMKDLGQFRFLTDDLSESLKELIFPMELGAIPSSADIARLKRNLSQSDREAFDGMLAKFLDENLATLEEQAKGSASEKLAALDSAAFLSTAFKTTEQGREAKKILIELNKDAELRKEISAKRLYDQILKKSAGTPERQADLLRAVGKRFPGTYYAELAESAALAGLAQRSSDGGEPKAAE